MLQEVSEILDPNKFFGTSQKSGKPWSKSEVKLKNGEKAIVFNPISVGDMVEQTVTVVGDKTYTNWNRVKQPGDFGPQQGTTTVQPPAQVTAFDGFSQKDRDMLTALHDAIVLPLEEV